MFENLVDAIQQSIEQRLSQINTNLPATIVSYDAARNRATVQVTIPKGLDENETIPGPQIVEVPVVWPASGAGKASFTMPLKAGDPVMLAVQQRSIENWLNGSNSVPDDPRQFDLTDSVAIPGCAANGIKADPDDAVFKFDKTQVRITKDNSVTLGNDKGTTTIDQSGNIVIQGPNVSIGSGATLRGAPGEVTITNANLNQSLPPTSAFHVTNKKYVDDLAMSGGGVEGPPGPQGPPGTAATIQVGTTTTGTPGTPANVTNTGDTSAAIFNFTIPAGIQGPQGIQGNPGPIGSQGPPGAQGIQGPPGSAGAQGPKGDTGAQGIQGNPGPEGPVGSQGPKGDTGAQGPQGIQGDIGPVGPQGPIGNTGPPGADSIVPGPQGPQGPKGDKGDPGATGATGSTGPQGPIGNTGPQGPKGDTGNTGPQGPIGNTGPAGPTAVSTDANNYVRLGSDSLIYAPLALPLTGGTTTGTITSPRFIGTASGGGTGAAFTVQANGNATYAWNDTGAGVDAKKWDAIANGGLLYFRAINDAENAARNWMAVSRNGAGLANTIWLSAAVTSIDSGKLSFANAAASSPQDLSRGIDFYGGVIGLGVSSTRLNYLVDANSAHDFYQGGNLQLTISNGLVDVHNALNVGGLATFRANVTSITADWGTVIGNNFTQGQGETDFFNRWNAYGGFRFYQVIDSAGTTRNVFNITPTGDLEISGLGISYVVGGSGTNKVGFSWTNGQIHGWIDGTDIGALASAAPGGYLPLSGGTLTGALTVQASIKLQYANQAFSPQLEWHTSNNGGDNNIWDAYVSGTRFSMRAVNDAYTGATPWLTVDRAGLGISQITMWAANITAITNQLVVGNSGHGLAGLYDGGGNPGYLALFNSTGARVGYVGFQNSNMLCLQVENGVGGWITNGNFWANGWIQADGSVYVGDSVWVGLGQTKTRIAASALFFQGTNLNRWQIESYPGDTGADFYIDRFNDSGTYVDSPVRINRASGDIGLAHNVTVNGDHLTTMRLVVLANPGKPGDQGQGAYIHWNVSNGDGGTWIMNQKGGGGGGIYFAETTTAGVLTRLVDIQSDGLLHSYDGFQADGAFTFNGNGTFNQRFTVMNGIYFGGGPGSTPQDLTKGIAFWGTTVGLVPMDGNTLAYNSGYTHDFYVGTTLEASINGAGLISYNLITARAGGGWGAGNVGKQLLITTPTNWSHPAIAITAADGTNYWGIINVGGELQFAAMPPYSDNATSSQVYLAISRNGQVKLPGNNTAFTMAPLLIDNGDSGVGLNNSVQIKFGFNQTGGQYAHWIASRHYAQSPGQSYSSALDFYLNDGTAADVYPTNAIWGGSFSSYGLSIPNGSQTNPSLNFGNNKNAGDKNIGLFNATGGVIGVAGRMRFTGGIDMNSFVAGNSQDLSHGIDFYGGQYGFNVTGGTLNYNVGPGSTHSFWSGTTNLFYVNTNGMNMFVSVNLAADPTSALQAATKQYVDSKVGGTGYLPTTGGTVTGTITSTKGGGGTNASFVVQTPGNAAITWYDTGGGTDMKLWDILTAGNQIYFRLMKDDQSNFGEFMHVWRSGTTASQINLMATTLSLQGNTINITGNETVNGSITVGSTGITYSTRGSNAISFQWINSTLHGWVDTTDLGALATQGWANSTFKAIGAYTPNQSVDVNASPTFSTGTFNGPINALMGGGNMGSNNAPVQISTTPDACIALNVSGVVATMIGLCQDGHFEIGGWSWGRNRLWMDGSGNLVMAGAIAAGGNLYSNNASIGNYFGLEVSGVSRKLRYSSDNWRLEWQGDTGNLVYYPSSGSWFFYASYDGFHVTGDVFAANVSDERVKRNVQSYDRGLSDLIKLRPISFEYNGLGGTADTGRIHYGLIAQEAQEYIPELVHETEKGPPDTSSGVPREFTHHLPGQLSLDREELIWVAINAIKELSARVESLENRRIH